MKKITPAHAYTIETNTSKDSIALSMEQDGTFIQGTVLSTLDGDNLLEGRKSSEPKGVNVLLLTGIAKVKDSLYNQWKNV